jgi:hypothetical protein
MLTLLASPAGPRPPPSGLAGGRPGWTAERGSGRQSRASPVGVQSTVSARSRTLRGYAGRPHAPPRSMAGQRLPPLLPARCHDGCPAKGPSCRPGPASVVPGRSRQLTRVPLDARRRQRTDVAMHPTQFLQQAVAELADLLLSASSAACSTKNSKVGCCRCRLVTSRRSAAPACSASSGRTTSWRREASTCARDHSLTAPAGRLVGRLRWAAAQPRGRVGTRSWRPP